MAKGMVAGIDMVVHQPSRLRMMARLVALARGEEVDFCHLRDVLGMTDGNLGAHLVKLEGARYVRVAKRFVGRRPRTFLAVTDKGRRAFLGHVKGLKRILRGG